MTKTKAKGSRGRGRPAWSLDVAGPICKSAARGRLRQFRGLPEFALDDLYNEAIQISLENHRHFDPRRTSYKTWLTRLVRLRLTDRFRTAAKDRQRREAYAAGRGEQVEDGQLMLARHGISRAMPTSSLVGTVAARLRRARGSRSVDEAARKSGIAASTIRELESGERGDVNLSTLERLALIYGMQVRELVGIERVSYERRPARVRKSLRKGRR